MTVKKLQQTQLFSMKRPGLERRFTENFEEQRSVKHTIESAVVVLVRNAFSPTDYSYLAQELICRLFLTSDVQELASVRHFCVLFTEFFTPEQWEKVISRLFESQEEYLTVTQTLREKTDHLHNMLHSGSRDAKEFMNISTVYKDANGKKHRFTLKDADPCYSIEETTDLLSILNTLTILEKDGVRRFTELVRYIYLPTEPVYDSEREAEVEAEPAKDLVKMLQPQISKALILLENIEVTVEGEASEPVLFLESSDYLKNNVYAGKTSEETIAFLLEGFTLSPESTEAELLSRILTAFTRGIRLKDAKADFSVKDVPDKSDKNAGTKKRSKKKKNKKQTNYLSAEELLKKQEQQEQKRLKHRLDKQTGKGKKNRTKRKRK